jgi:hypothetical protein
MMSSDLFLQSSNSSSDRKRNHMVGLGSTDGEKQQLFSFWPDIHAQKSRMTGKPNF